MSQQQQQEQQLMSSYYLINGDTNFDDLPQNVKDDMQAFVEQKAQKQKVKQLVDKIRADRYGSDSKKMDIKKQANTVERTLSALSFDIEHERMNVASLKSKIADDMESMRLMQSNLSTLLHGAQGNVNYVSSYFIKMIHQFENRKKELYQQIEDLANTLSIIEASQIPSGQMLYDTLRVLQEDFFASSARVAALHEQLDGQRNAFMRKMKVTEEFFQEEKKRSNFDYSFLELKKEPVSTDLPGFITPGQQPAQQQQTTTGLGTGLGSTGFGSTGFGTGTTGSGGFGFGTGTGTTGTSTGTTNTGFNFGTGTTGSTGTTGTGAGFGFGSTGATTGTGAGTTNTGFNFGPTGTTSTGTTNTGFNFGSTGTTGGTTGGGFGFGTTGTTGGTTGFSFT